MGENMLTLILGQIILIALQIFTIIETLKTRKEIQNIPNIKFPKESSQKIDDMLNLRKSRVIKRDENDQLIRKDG